MGEVGAATASAGASSGGAKGLSRTRQSAEGRVRACVCGLVPEAAARAEPARRPEALATPA